MSAFLFGSKHVLAALVLPPASLIFIAFVGLLIHRAHPRTGRAVTALALLALFAVSLPPVSGLLITTLERYPAITFQNLQRAQAIVILGGDVYRHGPEYGGDGVGGYTLQRVRYGASLQARTNLPILTSGTPVAELMKTVIEQEFHGKVRWAENRSWNTAESAAYCADILRSAGIHRIALVSSAWHLPRAVELFEWHGLEVLPAPTVFHGVPPLHLIHLVPTARALQTSSLALREWLAIVVQRVAGPMN
jgi:uncharacterized SAM-binding protein YcdF (DUF218 family)